MTASAELRALGERFWGDVMAANPTLATVLGDRRFDDRLEDRSAEAVDREIRTYAAAADRAAALDTGPLSPRERVTRQMLIDESRGLAGSLGVRLHDWMVDPLGGPQVTLPDLVDYQTITTPGEGRAMVRRWRAIGGYLDEIIAGLRRSVPEGRVAVREPVERTIDELAGLDALPVEAWKLAAPALAEHEDWSAAERSGFRRDLLAAVRDVAVPAFRRYREALEREILPVARPADRPGLIHVPEGDQGYRTLVRHHTTLDLEPRAIHELGRAEMARIDHDFVELGSRLLGTADLPSTLAALRDDPALRFTSSDEVFATAKASLERAEAAIPGWFGRLPRAACEVVPIPEHSQVHQTIAYYSWPAIDGSRPGRYYINLYAPESRPRYEAEALAFHESVPGHHLQIAIAQELDDLPAFQRNLGSTAFVEGWGLYTERLSEEMGLYSNDLDRFGILSFDAWRAGRLVVDTGMHALGWTRRQAIEYLHDHTALGDNNIVNEVDRYIVWPGQALAYKIGQLEILRLRDEAKRSLGDRFDIRAFHDVVLGSGAVSLPALGGLVEAWIAARGGATQSPREP